MFKFIVSSILIVLLNNCSNQVNYSGKILNQNNFNYLNYKNKDNLIKNFGNPSYIDPVSKKFFYFSEKKEKKSIFNKKINYSYVFVFEFNSDDLIISSNVYDLKNKKDIKNIEKETKNEVVKRGILERIFGGVGPQQSITTTP